MSDFSNKSLARIIAPMSEEVFFNEIWEKKHLVQNTGEQFTDILTIRDLLTILDCPGLSYPQLRVISNGFVIHMSAYCHDQGSQNAKLKDRVDPSRVMALFESGATLAFQGIHLWNKAVRELCSDISQQMGGKVTANAYLTPPSGTGFSLHSDAADIFIIQLQGRKTWRIARPQIELPLEAQLASIDLGEPARYIDKLLIEPNDRLYLPRGYLHECEASRGGPSLHLTISLRLLNWLDILKAAVDEFVEDPEFRKGVRISPVNGCKFGALDEHSFQKRLAAFTEACQRDKIGRKISSKYSYTDVN